MTSTWDILYFKDDKGNEPVKDFFKQPSRTGISAAEKKKFERRLLYLKEKGLNLIYEQSSILEKVKQEANLFSLRIPNKNNNPRVLLCRLPETQAFVLLHAFKETHSNAYERHLPLARKRRDLVCHVTNWVDFMNNTINNPYLGSDAVEHLASILPDTAEMRRVGKQEDLRLALTDALRKTRQHTGMIQSEIATSLGVSQSWVSKLENADYDHQIESVVTLLDALGAELLMAIKIDDAIIPVQPPSNGTKAESGDIFIPVPKYLEHEAKAKGMSTRELIFAALESYRWGEQTVPVSK